MASIQWARWGRGGDRAVDCLPEHVKPAPAETPEVDEVTNLFGRIVAADAPSGTVSFASRIRPENLVFFDAKPKLLRSIALAPLAPPHPGCKAFYRQILESGAGPAKNLRGYKVYRASRERGENAPWLYSSQPIFDERGEAKPGDTTQNKTVDLLPEGVLGHLTIALRGLTPRELAMVLQACAVPWRLGGGKPLGLGLCKTEIVRLCDELGQSVDVVNLQWETQVEDLQPRVELWKATQTPVAKLRYPRAVAQNKNKISHGGHVWYSRHAGMRKTSDGPATNEFQRLYLGDAARKKASGHSELPAQPLPSFDPNSPEADVLFGYDCIVVTDQKQRNLQTVINQIKIFDPTKHLTGHEASGGNTSQNRQTRQAGRLESRGESPPPPAQTPAAPSLPHVGQTVECVLSNEQTKKGGWKAKHEPTGKVGAIQNTKDVPPDKKAGEKITLIVATATSHDVQFRYATPEELKRSQKPPPKSPSHKPLRR